MIYSASHFENILEKQEKHNKFEIPLLPTVSLFLQLEVIKIYSKMVCTQESIHEKSLRGIAENGTCTTFLQEWERAIFKDLVKL